MTTRSNSEWRRGIETWASEHLEIEQLQAYVRGQVDELERRQIDIHTSACDACRTVLQEMLHDVASPSWPRGVVLVFEQLKYLGSASLGLPALAAAEVESPVLIESAQAGNVRVDARLSPADEIIALVSESENPKPRWRVRLQRLDANGRVLNDEAEAITDAHGEARLGPGASFAPRAVGEWFRLVADPPPDMPALAGR